MEKTEIEHLYKVDKLSSMISDVIIDFYARGGEINRLNEPLFVLEGIRTKEIINRYLLLPNMEVLDIGGGAGYYAFWLQDQGHNVTLVDLSPENIRAATERSTISPRPLKRVVEGNALDLPFINERFDLILMLGPLYHLTDRKERVRAISHAVEFLKPGGKLIMAVISRYASLMDGFNRDLIQDEVFFEIMQHGFRTGLHANHSNNPEYFTTAYFHKHAELREEVMEAGLQFESLIAVESIGWLIKDLDKKQSDIAYMRKLLDTIKDLESNEELMAVSPHIIGVARL